MLALLTDDAWFTMPPASLEYQGAAAIGSFLAGSARFRAGRRARLVATRANGQPAFGRHVLDEHAPIRHLHGVIVLTLAGDICAITRFIEGRPGPALRPAAHAA